MSLPTPPLLVISDRRQARGGLAEVTAAALAGGCRWLLLREKDLPFFEAELRFRRSMRYPPVVAMVNAIVRAARFDEAMRDAGTLVAELRDDPAFQVLGPAPAPIQRVKGEYRVQFFLKGTHRPSMREAVQAALARHAALRRRVTIDVDPLSVL